MQRASSLNRPADDRFVINIWQQQQQQQQGRQSPIQKLRPWTRYWIHGIPVMVLLVFFFLWWFSEPVYLEKKDNRIIAIRHIMKPDPIVKPDLIADNQVDIAILATATSPIASVPKHLSQTDETVALPVSKAD